MASSRQHSTGHSERWPGPSALVNRHKLDGSMASRMLFKDGRCLETKARAPNPLKNPDWQTPKLLQRWYSSSIVIANWNQQCVKTDGWGRKSASTLRTITNGSEPGVKKLTRKWTVYSTAFFWSTYFTVFTHLHCGKYSLFVLKGPDPIMTYGQRLHRGVLSALASYFNTEKPTKMAKIWILSGQLPPWLATGAGHRPDGSAPHQYRWADVVWAPCCRDCVMGCCGVLVVFHWPLVARGNHILHLGPGLLRARLLGLCCTAAFPLIFLQLRKGPL